MPEPVQQKPPEVTHCRSQPPCAEENQPLAVGPRRHASYTLRDHTAETPRVARGTATESSDPQVDDGCRSPPEPPPASPLELMSGWCRNRKPAPLQPRASVNGA